MGRKGASRQRTRYEIPSPCGCATVVVEFNTGKCVQTDDAGSSCSSYASTESAKSCGFDCACESCDSVRYEAEEMENCQLINRFAMHHATCYYCDESPILGVRWVYSYNSDYSACTSCKFGDCWTPTPFQWKTAVPKAPLSEADPEWCDRVQHLQKVLTQLNYMNLSDTSKAIGYFGKRTGNAVEWFKRVHGLYHGNLRKYDKVTERKLQEVFCRDAA